MTYFSENWMSYLDDNKKLTELTIPGTHDTCTYSATGAYQCQTMNLETQFKNGIRFWDIRLKVKGDRIFGYHGSGKLDIEFHNILTTSSVLMQQFPSECIVMSISHEQNQNNKELYDKLWPIIKDLNHWYKEDRIPKISEVRGKIVFFRRFRTQGKLSFPVGINAYGNDDKGDNYWPDNTTKRWTNTANIAFCVQDEYKWYTVSALSNKFNNYAKEILQQALEPVYKETLFLNFMSGTGDVFPITIATGKGNNFKGTNHLLQEFISNKGNGRYGIIPMDFPNPLLINRLFSCNPFNFPSIESIKSGNVYEIRSRLDLNKCLDVSGNVKTDGTQVIIHTSNNQLNQRWKLADAGDGYFYIHTLTQNATDSVLDVAGNTAANGTNIIVHKQKNGNNQKWKITKLENGYFILQPKNAPNSLLDLFEAKTDDGSPVKIFTKSENDWAEQWALILIK